MYRNAFIFILAIHFFLPAIGQDLNALLKEIESSPGMEKARIGVSLKNTKDDKSLVNFNGRQSMLPASVQKLLIGYEILEKLDEKYRYKTFILYTGEILDDGTLMGDLIIRGTGDPSLGTWRFDVSNGFDAVFNAVVSAVKKAGITCIDGDVIVDASKYGTDALPHSWTWEDIGNYYGAGVWSINIHENLYKLGLKRSVNPGKPVSVSYIKPFVPNLSFTSEVLTAGKNSGDEAYIFGSPYNYSHIIRGTIPAGKGVFTIKGAIPDPARLFLEYLEGTLKMSNISYNESKVQWQETDAKKIKIGELKSPRLKSLVRESLHESINLYSEAFLKTYAGGDRLKAIEKLEKKMKEMGLNTAEIKLQDGSGLSPLNRMTPNFLSSYLSKKVRQNSWETVTGLLPIVGKEGTVKNMLKKSPIQNKIWAKSGSLDGVLNYAGYMVTELGTKVSFAIFVEGHDLTYVQTRAKIERILEKIYHSY